MSIVSKNIITFRDYHCTVLETGTGYFQLLARYWHVQLLARRQKNIEFTIALCYIKSKESTHSKVDAPSKRVNVLTDTASPVGQTGGAFLFVLVSLIEKGKQRYN